jgi:hypothetical protein
MSWLSSAWDWYIANPEIAAPLLAPLGSVFVGMGTIIVGGVVAWSALRQARTATNRHREQTRADQQRRVTESFSKAVEQLAHKKIEARLGGIYTLERLAIEAIAQVRSTPWWRRLLLRLLRRNDTPPADPVSDLYWTVMETLTAFVRERARWKEPEPSEPARSGPPSPPTRVTDIAAVLDVLRRRPDAGRERETLRQWRLDLSMTNLRDADLRETHLERADLIGAHLEGTTLVAAHLERAFLGEAHLEGAILFMAHLHGADLRGAHLEGADLRAQNLERADLRGAIGDAKTRLPDGVARPADWPPYAP